MLFYVCFPQLENPGPQDAKQLQELKVENDMVLALVYQTEGEEYEEVHIEYPDQEPKPAEGEAPPPPA